MTAFSKPRRFRPFRFSLPTSRFHLIHRPVAAPVQVMHENPEVLEGRVAGLPVVVAVVNLLRDGREVEQAIHFVTDVTQS